MVLTVVGPVRTDAGGFTVIQQPSCRKYSGWGGGGGGWSQRSWCLNWVLKNVYQTEKRGGIIEGGSANFQRSCVRWDMNWEMTWSFWGAPSISLGKGSRGSEGEPGAGQHVYPQAPWKDCLCPVPIPEPEPVSQQSIEFFF